MNESEDVRMIQDLFRKADVDKNGILNRIELAQIMKQLQNGQEPTTEDVDRLFKMIDVDGSNSIEEEEFTRILGKWLRVSRTDTHSTSPKDGNGYLSPGRLRQRSSSSSDTFNRRKVQSEIKNFFQQFESKPNDPRVVIERILSSPSIGLNLKSLRRGLREYSKEEKAMMHSQILTIIQSGQSSLNPIIVALHSSQTEDIYNSLVAVSQLLEITEAFTTNTERLEMSVIFMEIFEALIMTPTHLLGPDMRPLSSIISRILHFIDPNTPTQILILALKCARDFAWGPNIPSLNVDSPWYPERYLTKAILEGQAFLPRMMNILVANPMVTSSNQAILIAVFDTLTAYVEVRTSSLQEALHLHLREHVLNIFHQGMSLDLMRSITSLIGVLSGYSHTGGDNEFTASLIDLLVWPSQQLDVILAVCNKTFQDMIDTVIQGSNIGFDSIVVINTTIILQQVLSLCNLQHPLFSSLVGHLLQILKHYQQEYAILSSQFHASPVKPVQLSPSLSLKRLASNSNSELLESQRQIFQYIARAVDNALTELCYNFNEVSQALLQNDDFLSCLKAQLRSYAIVDVDPGSSYAAALGDGLEVVRCAMSVLYAMIETGFIGRVLDIFGESIFLLSNISSIRFWIVKILHFCCIHDAEETAKHLVDIGIIDLLFGLLLRYKTYNDPTLDILNLSELGAYYDLEQLERILASLIALASLQTTSDVDGKTYMTLASKFTAEHVDILVMLHTSFCYELSNGNLVSPQEAVDLNQLSMMMNQLLSMISDGHHRIKLPPSRSLIASIGKHHKHWNEQLTNAYDEGVKLIHDTAYGGYRTINYRRKSYMEQEDDGSNMVSSTSSSSHRIIRGLPFLHVETSSEFMVVLRPVTVSNHNNADMFVETDDEKRYYIDPSISLKDLVFSASYLYEHMVSLYVRMNHAGVIATTSTIMNMSLDDRKYVQIENDDHLRTYIQHIINTTNPSNHQQQPSSSTTGCREIWVYLMSSKASLNRMVDAESRKKMLENAALPPKDQVLTDIRRLTYDHNVKIDLGMMENFYKYFEAKHVAEIDLPLFVEAMMAVTVPETFARDMFRAFDIDKSGTLSLKEIAVGLGKLMDGDQDDILHIVFRAYDLDNSDSLDFPEVVHMISNALGVSQDLGAMYATAAFQAMNLDKIAGLSFLQFRDAVYSNKLQVGGLWASGLPTLRTNEKKKKPPFYNGQKYNDADNYDDGNKQHKNNSGDKSPRGGKTYFNNNQGRGEGGDGRGYQGRGYNAGGRGVQNRRMPYH